MQTRRIATIVTVVAALTLLLAAGSTLAGPPVEGGKGSGRITLAGTVASKISYQGRLTDAGGNPLNGNYNLVFQLWDDATAGNQVGSDIVKNNVPVSNGLFTVGLDVPQDAFNGQALWLRVQVNGEWLWPRQALLPVPYALSLKPGAAMSASIYDGPVLRVENTDPNPAGGGYALVGKNASNYTWRPAIYGENTGASAGVYGRSDGWHATVGWQAGSDPSHAGVYGHNAGAGPGVKGESTNNAGGLFNSTNGHGVHIDGAGAHGVDVAAAGGSGVQVYSAGGSGVRVVSAGNDGVRVDSANWSGVWVGSAGSDALRVQTAGQDGLRIFDTVGRDYIRAGSNADPDFKVLKTGEVRSDVGFNTPASDFAEMMAVEGETTSYEPGDVLVVSDAQNRAVALSSTPYSHAVIGVYSTAPGFVGGHPVSDDDQTSSVPVAILGIVPCRVSAENGPIHRGDLLTTSSTPGHAMKASEPKLGTILGKALGELKSGTGVMDVLITLQ